MSTTTTLESGMKAPKLQTDGSNWMSWKGTIMLQLGRRGYSAHLRRQFQPPLDPAEADDYDWNAIQADTALLATYRAEERTFTDWQNANDAVRLHIQSRLPESLTTSALRRKVAKDLWAWLLDEFEVKGATYAQTLRKQISNKVCPPTGDLRTHLEELEDMREKYGAAAGEPMLESEFHRTAIASLPERYRMHIASLISYAEVYDLPLPSNEALLRSARKEYDRVTLEAQEEAAKKKKATAEVALAADGGKKAKQLKPKKAKCFGCGEVGHFARND